MVCQPRSEQTYNSLSTFFSFFTCVYHFINDEHDKTATYRIKNNEKQILLKQQYYPLGFIQNYDFSVSCGRMSLFVNITLRILSNREHSTVSRKRTITKSKVI